jgi:hypothetical protein
MPERVLMSRRAVVMVRDREPYPPPQFAEGLRRLGYSIHTELSFKPTPDDVLLIWNRMGAREIAARSFEAVGAAVIVAENGWIGKALDGGKMYALCLGHHNGRGTWFVGEEDRLQKMRFAIKPWREGGDHVLVICSRGIGEPGIAQPRDWPISIARRLRVLTDRPVKVRLHPGDSHASLDDDLRNAFCGVTWASGGAIKALAAGVPIFYELTGWIGASASVHGFENMVDPYLGDRLPMFRRLAWAQWSAAEIATGEPLACLLKSRSTG